MKKKFYQLKGRGEIPKYIEKSKKADYEVGLEVLIPVDGKYKLTELLTYQNGILMDKARLVENELEEAILFQWLNPDTDVVKLTEKLYFENGEQVFEFIYGGNGELSSINSTIHDDTIYPKDLASPKLNWSWDGLEYYKNAAPVIPNT